MDILKQIYKDLAVSVNICVNIELFLVTKKLLTSHFLTAKSGCIAERKFLEKFKMKFTFILLLTIFSMHNVHSTQMSLEEINDTELVKLINQETYVVVLFSK